MPSLYDKTLPVGASGVGLHLGGARWLLLPTWLKPDPATQQRQRTQLARSSTMLANQPMLHQSSAAAKSLRRNHLHAANVRVQRGRANDSPPQKLQLAASVATHGYASYGLLDLAFADSAEFIFSSYCARTPGRECRELSPYAKVSSRCRTSCCVPPITLCAATRLCSGLLDS